MARISGWLGALVGYLCVGTILAQLLGVGYLWNSGRLNKEKALKMLAIAHEIDLDSLEPSRRKIKEEPDAPAEPSFEDYERARKIKSRYLELKTEALDRGLEQLRFAREEYAQDKDRYERVKLDFQTELAKMSGGAKSEGIAAVRLIWENIKPKAAKEQIMQMVEQGEIEDVVVILADMPISKRAKIVSAFVTDEEVAALDNLLRLIRKGAPEVTLIDETIEETEQP